MKNACKLLLAMAATTLLLPSVSAQGLTGWSDYHSEEDGAFICPAGSFMVAMECDDDYCDNKRYKCRKGYQTIGGEVYSGWQKSYTCPKGSYIDLMQCKGPYCEEVSVRCTKLAVPEFLSGKASCSGTKTISEEASTWNGYDGDHFELEGGQLLGAFSCSGDHCDNISVTTCNPYGAGEDSTYQAVLNKYGWKKVLDISGGEAKLTYRAGVTDSTSSTTTVGLSTSVTTGLSTTVGAEAGVEGIASAKTEATASASLELSASLERESGKAMEAERGFDVEVTCNKIDDRAERGAVYAFALKEEKSGIALVSKSYQCQYGRASIPPPVCMPDACDNALAENCQKCAEGHSFIPSQLGKSVPVPFIKEENNHLPLGSFVYFKGVWEWANGRGDSNESIVALYNNGSNDVTYCYGDTCVDLKGTDVEYGESSRTGGELKFPWANGFFHFTSPRGGTLNGKFWGSNQNRNGPPEATVTMEQHNPAYWATSLFP